MSTDNIPFSCPKCRAEGSPTGALVFKGQEVPVCKYHPGTEFVRSHYYDPEGNRVLDIPKEYQHTDG